MCEENKLEEKTTLIEIIFLVKHMSLKDHIGRVWENIKRIFSMMIYHTIKVLVVYEVNY